MSYKFVEGDFKSLSRAWRGLFETSISYPIFSSLEWTQSWWLNFNQGFSSYLGAISSGSRVIGIAPLMVKEDTAFLMGGEDVCDYLDFIIGIGYEEVFFKSLLNQLIDQGIARLNMTPVRGESSVMTTLLSLCQEKGLSISVSKTDVSPYLELTKTWEDYLHTLNRKQRHELKRKIRRLNEVGEIKFYTVNKADDSLLDTFFKLFRNSREDKAQFLSPAMEKFFRSAFAAMSEMDCFRLSTLTLNDSPIAETVCFDFNRERLLYNSGYDTNYGWLSAGLISKAMCIQEGIGLGMRKFDFLRGNEEYKYHLGGTEAPIYHCNVLLSNKI